jgi:ribosomal protein S6--L-glutamate ligase
VTEAYITSSDVEIGQVKLRNIDGEDNDITINMHNSIIFVRAGAIQSLTAQALVSSLQTIGFFLVNDLESMLLCDNKMASSLALERNNVPIPRTAIINNVKSIEDAHKRVGGKFPVIIKTLRGTQGVGVSKVNDMASLTSVCQSLWKFEADLLIQEFFDIKSDIRTLVVNGHIIGAAERIKRDSKEFRNNVHLGADTEPYVLTDKEAQIIVEAARTSGAVYCGVDHCKIGKDVYVLEVNGSPGIRSHFMGYDEEGEPTKKIKDEIVLGKVIDKLSLEENRRPLMRKEVGVIESIRLDGMEDNLIRAKFDTGNSTAATMLHVDKLEIDGDTAKWEKNGIKFESDIIDVSKAYRGKKLFDTRPVIEHGITFNNRKYVIEMGLTLKDTASEMLVNRKTMTKLRVSVHPNRKFIVSDYAGKDDAYTKD